MTPQTVETLIQSVKLLTDQRKALIRVLPNPSHFPQLYRHYDAQLAEIDGRIDAIGRTIEAFLGTTAAECILLSGIIRSDAWEKEGRMLMTVREAYISILYKYEQALNVDNHDLARMYSDALNVLEHEDASLRQVWKDRYGYLPANIIGQNLDEEE